MKKLFLIFLIVCLFFVLSPTLRAGDSSVTNLNELTAPAYNDWLLIDDTSDAATTKKISVQNLTSRAATLVVAASDASALMRANADYLCDGTADEVQINAAIAALPSIGATKRGRVLLSEGRFYIAAAIDLDAGDTVAQLTLQGQGITTTFIEVSQASNCDALTYNGTSRYFYEIRDLHITGNAPVDSGYADAPTDNDTFADASKSWGADTYNTNYYLMILSGNQAGVVYDITDTTDTSLDVNTTPLSDPVGGVTGLEDAEDPVAANDQYCITKNYSGHGIHISADLNDLKLTHIFVQSFAQNGIFIDNSTVWGHLYQEIIVEHNLGYGVKADKTGEHGFKIYSSKLIQNYNSGLELGGLLSGQIVDNEISVGYSGFGGGLYSRSKRAANLGTSCNVIFTGNLMRYGEETGVAEPANFGLRIAGDNNIIMENYIEDFDYPIYLLSTADHNIIAENEIVISSTDPIEMQGVEIGGSENTFSNNVIKGYIASAPAKYCLKITGDNNVATGNFIEIEENSASTAYGIQTPSGADCNTIVNNIISVIKGDSVKPLDNGGTGNIVDMNHLLLNSAVAGLTISNIDDGTHEDAKLFIRMIEASNCSTVSVDKHATSSPEVFDFQTLGDFLILEWDVTNTYWTTLQNSGVEIDGC